MTDPTQDPSTVTPSDPEPDFIEAGTDPNDDAPATGTDSDVVGPTDASDPNANAPGAAPVSDAPVDTTTEPSLSDPTPDAPSSVTDPAAPTDGAVVTGDSTVGTDGDPVDPPASSAPTDVAGNSGTMSPPSDPTTSDPTPPAQISTSITDPSDGADLTDGDITVSGTVTGDEGGFVRLYDGQSVISDNVAITDNAWQSAATLAQGDHELWAAYVNSDDSEGEPSGVVDVTVDPAPDPVEEQPAEQRPDAPVIVSPEAGAQLQGGATVVRGTSTGNGDTVLIYEAGEDPDSGTQLTPTPLAVNDGAFSTNLSLEQGHHRLYATERNSYGNTSDPSAVVEFEVEAVPELPPASEPDARLAHHLRHGLMKHRGVGVGWAEMADLIVAVEEWLERKGL